MEAEFFSIIMKALSQKISALDGNLIIIVIATYLMMIRPFMGFLNGLEKFFKEFLEMNYKGIEATKSLDMGIRGLYLKRFEGEGEEK